VSNVNAQLERMEFIATMGSWELHVIQISLQSLDFVSAGTTGKADRGSIRATRKNKHTQGK
jgi:hypothetical protein